MNLLNRLFAFILLVMSLGISAKAGSSVELETIGGLSMPGASEIVAHDPRSQHLFVTTGADNELVVLDVSDPTNPTIIRQVDLSAWGSDVNSVSVNRFGLVAVAIAQPDKTRNGSVLFFDTAGNYLHRVTVGALPDMLTFDRSGTTLLVANEGEPADDYSFDPEGSVSIINVPRRLDDIKQASVQNLFFEAYDDAKLDSSIRIFGPDATVSKDLEPEYISLSRNGRYAYVTCQENNAIAIVDIRNSEIIDLVGLGFKDHSLPGNGMDASDNDTYDPLTLPVLGIYMPDAIASLSKGGIEYLFTANEGDSRDYSAFSEEEKVKNLDLDDTLFPNEAALKSTDVMGDLRVTTTMGHGEDEIYEQLYSFGARSFSVWSHNPRTGVVEQVYDSGDDIEQIIYAQDPDNYPHGRADNKGPEPEGVTVARLYGKYYAFVGLERASGIMVYNVNDPTAPEFVQYINTVSSHGDSQPEGLIVIDKKDSPTHEPLLVVTYEDSGTMRIFRINRVRN